MVVSYHSMGTYRIIEIKIIDVQLLATIAAHHLTVMTADITTGKQLTEEIGIQYRVNLKMRTELLIGRMGLNVGAIGNNKNCTRARYVSSFGNKIFEMLCMEW